MRVALLLSLVAGAAVAQSEPPPPPAEVTDDFVPAQTQTQTQTPAPAPTPPPPEEPRYEAIRTVPLDAPLAPAAPRVQVSYCPKCTAVVPWAGKGLRDFADNAQQDPELGARANELLSRHGLSSGFFWASLVTAALTLVAMPLVPETVCSRETPCTDGQTPTSIHPQVLAVGGSITATFLVLYVVYRPVEKDLVALLNDWNARHPEDYKAFTDF